MKMTHQKKELHHHLNERQGHLIRAPSCLNVQKTVVLNISGANLFSPHTHMCVSVSVSVCVM